MSYGIISDTAPYKSDSYIAAKALHQST